MTLREVHEHIEAILDDPTWWGSLAPHQREAVILALGAARAITKGEIAAREFRAPGDPPGA